MPTTLAALVALALAVGLASSPGLAVAQPPADGTADGSQRLDEAARLTYESARDAFVRGDYEQALELFRRAYELSPRPGLLYNIAQTLDRLRRDRDTVDALRAYLEAAPEARNRQEVEARIGVLEASLQEQEAEEAARREAEQARAVVPEDGADAGRSGVHPAVFFTTAGLTVVGGVLTVVFGLITNNKNDTYVEATQQPDATFESTDPLFQDARTFQLLTNISWISAAAFGAASLVLAFFTDWDALGGGGDEAGAQAGWVPDIGAGPNGVQLGATYRFF